MIKCVFTKQKTKKKDKKWQDAEMEIRNKRLVLKDENGKIVCSTMSYELVDDTVITPTCMIYADDIEEMIREEKEKEKEATALRQPKEETTAVMHKQQLNFISKLHKEKNGKEEILGNVSDEGISVDVENILESEKRPKGRDLVEMLKLIRKK